MEPTTETGFEPGNLELERPDDRDALIAQGYIFALFAFDIGYEISLEKLANLFPSAPVQPLSHKKLTPTFTQYVRPPRVLELGSSPGLFEIQGQVRATLFDFGVVSIAFRWPLSGGKGTRVTDLPAISQHLYQLNLVAKAKEHAQSLAERIQPAITRPFFSTTAEDYYLYVIEKLATPLEADELLRRYYADLAQALRFETTALSAEQQDDALRQRLSYYQNDLLLIDWNAAIIYDQDYEDAANVLELLNVELLEARYIDSELDKRIQEHAYVAQRRREWPIPLRTPFHKKIQELGELRIESALLAERLGNSLKLVGDLYLARVYSTAAERFYLRQWQKIISDKLDTIDDFYELLTDRIHTAQSQTLELAVILLILVELFVALIRH
jgi:hypothetical protein